MTTEATMRARATDPITSHIAAVNASRFAGTHADRIMAVLEHLGCASTDQIAMCAGLTVVQTARRLPELERSGRARVVTQDGQDVHNGRYRVWRAA